MCRGVGVRPRDLLGEPSPASMNPPHAGHRRVTVLSPSRIHLGLLQLSAAAHPTINMGLGAALTHPRWILDATIASPGGLRVNRQPFAMADDVVEAAETLLAVLADLFGRSGFQVRVVEGVPAHRGLGSKTSLLCGILAAAAALTGRRGEWPRHRPLTRRGGTSGIGINAAVQGGVILDAGHSEAPGDRTLGPSRQRVGRPIPVVAARWEIRRRPFLLAIPKDGGHLHGQQEVDLFRANTPLPQAEVADLAALVLYSLVPALANQDASSVFRALELMQRLGMKSREWNAQPARVHSLRRAFLEAGASCVALSSMGPALAVFASDPAAVGARVGWLRDCQVLMTSVRNKGVVVWDH
jgi:beta-ribofuranosylaminobenzene 5'-phosphate synthase